MTLTASNLRTIIKQFVFVEREDIEKGGPISDKRWRDWQADPHGMFMKLNDDQQDAVTETVNQRLALGHNSRREFAPSVGATL